MTLTRDEVLAGLERLSRGFMTPSITDRQTWLRIEGTNGITFLLIEELGQNRSAFLLLSEEAQLATIRAYYDGTPESVEIITGYGARLSAPGYPDCTEWAVFDSCEAAEEYLVEMYGDEETEDSEES